VSIGKLLPTFQKNVVHLRSGSTGSRMAALSSSSSLLRWHYSPMRTFASLMTHSQSALFFDLSFQLLILHFLMPVCTQFHHLFLGRPLGRLPWGLLLNTEGLLPHSKYFATGFPEPDKSSPCPLTRLEDPF
jgi:hypothetical protein